MVAPSMPTALRYVASKPEGRSTRNLHALLFGRKFDAGTARRLLILFESNRISYASVFPFLIYAKEFAAQYDVQIRLLPTQRALSGGLPKGLDNPTHVLAQTWLTDPPERQVALARLLSQLPEGTVTAYLDTFANADIRLASIFPNIDYYFKKSIFVDPSHFFRQVCGHTNLTDYYGHLYNFPEKITDWQVPESTLRKLRIAPNFLTDPSLMKAFLSDAAAPSLQPRNIDLHARLGGTNQNGWYGEMRRQATKAVDELNNVNVVSGIGVSRAKFMEEMRQSKICFSPFGFGEICWRDIEAIATGAVLVKPDMSHLRTEPNLFRDGETYVACRWDFSDLREKVSHVLNNRIQREQIAKNAWEIAHHYLSSAGPVSTYGSLFELEDAK